MAFVMLVAAAGWFGVVFLRQNPSAPAAGMRRAEAAAGSRAIVQAFRCEQSPPPPAAEPELAGLHLRTGTLFPPDNPAAEPEEPVWHSRPSTRGYPWLVLLAGPIQDNWRTSIESAGAVIRAAIPKHGLLVEAPLALRKTLAALPGVVWVTEYRPAFKVQPLLSAIAKKEPDLFVPVTLQTFAPEDTTGILEELAAAGASDLRGSAGKRWGILRGVLPARRAVEFSRLPEIQWIEYYDPPRPLNDFARTAAQLNLEAIHEHYGLTGTGQIVAVADTGLDTGNRQTLHPDFAGRLLEVFDLGRGNDWSDRYYHGTHVAASLLGTGAASGGQYRGMAPDAQLIFQSIMDAYYTLSGLPDDLNELYRPTYELGARIHSDSWGSPVDGEYNSDSMTTDEFVWDHPAMLVVFAAGNEGVDWDRNGVIEQGLLDAPASAKNVLAVGAAESGRPSGSGGKTSQTYNQAWGSDYPVPPISTDLISSSPSNQPPGIAAFSSRGPTRDGRIKPDVVAPGTDVVSARSRASADTGWGVVADNTNYCFLGGTSMATPLAAGAAAIVRQYCVEIRGIPEPSAALLKAALAGGARSLTPGQYGTNQYREIPPLPRPNVVEGYGLPDIAATLYPPDGIRTAFIDDAPPLITGTSNVLTFWVVSNAPCTVALAYSDYPAALSAAYQLVNDLDLLVVDPTGAPHYPNGLSGADRRNNMEVIDLAAPATGRWTLVVSGQDVPQAPQPYALYLRGAIRLPITILHTPLANTCVTSGSYRVEAEVFSPAPFDTNLVHLVWIASGKTGGFETVVMTTTNGRDFQAEIPAQPVGKLVGYYLAAGPPEMPAYHPAGAPAALHIFEVTPALSLTISGDPANYFSAYPDYGNHLLASNLSLRARAIWPVAGTNGWRTACVGWTGTGSVPPTGEMDFCDLILRENSTLTWLWQPQVALTHTSTPPGALNAIVWHPLNSSASTLIAPESHRFNNTPLTFAGWQVDGLRWPTNSQPSRHQVTGIPMAAPRTATATYLATDLDQDQNGLPDWFELRYFNQLGQSRYGDPDGDGFENELEAADHTDPLDDQSVPAPPVIHHTPLASPATSPAPWKVTAVITDNYRVASATLCWQRNGGLLRSAPMTNIAGITYAATLPSPARNGDTIRYFLEARDTAGFLAQTETQTVTVSYAKIELLAPVLTAEAPAFSQTNAWLMVSNAGSQPLEFSMEIVALGFWDDVESGTNQWLRPDGNTDWHISSYRWHSPSNAWYCGQEGTRTYRNSTHAALVTPPIRLAQGAPRLDFRHWARFEIDNDDFPDGIHYWDSGLLEITDNGGRTWNSLVPEGGYPGLITSNPASPFAPDTPCFVDTVDWEAVGANLSPYAGKAVQIRFRFGADAYVVAEGWRLDDISVSPRSRFSGWATISDTNLVIPPKVVGAFSITLDTTPIPPMDSDHTAILIHHNDPERSSPIFIPLSLRNHSRRVRVITSGPGSADPDGESFVGPDSPFILDLAAESGHFIADIRYNSLPQPVPKVLVTQTLVWTSLATNLEIQVTFAPILAENLVPPAWLAQYGLTNRHWMAEASLDHDRDGLLTWQEYFLNSNPLNPADARLELRLLPPQPPNTNWHIFWHAFTNRHDVYSLQTSPDLTEPFSHWTNLPAAPPLMTSPPLPTAPAFFRLQRQ